MRITIRFATAQDAAGIQAIYAPIVRDTVTSFEMEVPSVDDMRQRIVQTVIQYPWLVGDDGGTVCGYAYAGAYRKRTAYQWSVEVSVYVHADCRRQGVGRALYTALFALLIEQGYVSAFAGATLPNPGSVGLHEAMGFQPVGVYPNVGYKMGAWHDVGWWGLALQPPPADPAPPRPISEIVGTPAWEDAMRRGEQLLAGR